MEKMDEKDIRKSLDRNGFDVILREDRQVLDQLDPSDLVKLSEAYPVSEPSCSARGNHALRSLHQIGTGKEAFIKCALESGNYICSRFNKLVRTLMHLHSFRLGPVASLAQWHHQVPKTYFTDSERAELQYDTRLGSKSLLIYWS